MSWAVVVPTIRPERFDLFLQAWLPLFAEHKVALHVVVDAEDSAPYRTRLASVDQSAAIHWWKRIPDWIPRQTDMIRSWGIYQSWNYGWSDFTLSLDDDVLPEGDIFAAYEAVFDAGAPCSDYLDVGALTDFDGQMRGFPFRERAKAEVAVQYGGWHGVLDFDAPTQLATQPGKHRFSDIVLPVPRGAAVTGCIMNCAWRTEYAPIMWQLPLLDGKYNRFGDIWSCLFQKRVLDALGKVMVVNGKASVRHERASDPIANLERETPGIRANEMLWRCLGDFPDQDPGVQWGRDMLYTDRRVAGWAEKRFGPTDPEYAVHFRDSLDKWLALFA